MALSETTQELIDTIAEARAVIREMHAATKDLRQAVAEARRVTAEARRVTREELESQFSERVNAIGREWEGVARKEMEASSSAWASRLEKSARANLAGFSRMIEDATAMIEDGTTENYSAMRVAAETVMRKLREMAGSPEGLSAWALDTLREAEILKSQSDAKWAKWRKRNISNRKDRR